MMKRLSILAALSMLAAVAVFAAGPLNGGDPNCDGTNDISDLTYYVDYMFAGGAVPCALASSGWVYDGSYVKLESAGDRVLIGAINYGGKVSIYHTGAGTDAGIISTNSIGTAAKFVGNGTQGGYAEYAVFGVGKSDYGGAQFRANGSTNSGPGLMAISEGSGAAVYAWAQGTGRAGSFLGDVLVTGSLSKGAGSFKIDHPLDPENKYLYHSFVESPDMMNVYNGNAVLDAGGAAIVTLPDYFESLNSDYRYQLTCIGGFAPVYIAEKINGNQFKIAGGQPGLEVSWQVTGVRRDAFAKANRIQVEVDKEPEHLGAYLHPEAFGFGPDRGFEVDDKVFTDETK